MCRCSNVFFFKDSQHLHLQCIPLHQAEVRLSKTCVVCQVFCSTENTPRTTFPLRGRECYACGWKKRKNQRDALHLPITNFITRPTFLIQTDDAKSNRLHSPSSTPKKIFFLWNFHLFYFNLTPFLYVHIATHQTTPHSLHYNNCNLTCGVGRFCLICSRARDCFILELRKTSGMRLGSKLFLISFVLCSVLIIFLFDILANL